MSNQLRTRILVFFCYGLMGVTVGIFQSSCWRNLPPEKPILLGPDSAGVGDTILIRLYTVDPEEQVVTYKVEWGDTTTPVWSHFFPSGETTIRNHIYYDTGSYPIRAKAKDIDRGESDWSDTLRLRIEP